MTNVLRFYDERSHGVLIAKGWSPMRDLTDAGVLAGAIGGWLAFVVVQRNP